MAIWQGVRCALYGGVVIKGRDIASCVLVPGSTESYLMTNVYLTYG